MVPKKTLTLCFVSLNACGAIAGVDCGHVGGIERQQSIMTHWLSKQGHSISVITWDEGPDMLAQVNDIKIHKICKRTDGVRGLRFFYPRWSSLCQAMKEADADIYCYNNGDLLLGQIVLWAHLHGKKVAFTVASDPACQSTLPTLKSMRERVLYKYGLLHCDSIITQTVKQQRMLEQDFGLQSIKIPMPCQFFNDNRILEQKQRMKHPLRILWIGRISKEKRLEWLLECAPFFEDVVFDVIGNANTGNKYSDELIERAKKIKNITLHGRIEHSKISSFYNNAALLINTSEYEGFPNTFLEAWSMGVPVISTVDPDGIIEKRQLGVVVDSVQSIVGAIKRLRDDSEQYEAMSLNAHRYFEAHHTVDFVLPKFESAFCNLLV